MSVAARVRLGSYAWPGNVRQLRNVIESMVVVDCDETLDVDDLPLELEPPAGAAAAPAAVDMQSGLAALVGRPLEEVERIFITETLRLTGGNREQAAELLRIGERTLYRKIKEYQLT
jgi:two-component system response regulator HydG